MALEQTENLLQTRRRTRFMDALVAIGNAEERVMAAVAYPLIEALEVTHGVGLTAGYTYKYELTDWRGRAEMINHPSGTSRHLLKRTDGRPFTVGTEVAVTVNWFGSLGTDWISSGIRAKMIYLPEYVPKMVSAGLLIGRRTSTAPTVENNGRFLTVPPDDWEWPAFITKRAI